MNTWDLIVVGAGAVGSAALRAASECGARTLAIEQFTPASARGSSHGHSRIFRHAYFEHPDYVPLLLHATARLESLERESGAALLNRCGMLLVGAPDSEAVLGSLASARRWGLALETLDVSALRARYPWFSFADDATGAFEPNAGIVRPESTVDASVRIARSRGVELRTATRVQSVAEDASGVSVVTNHGTERASAVIISAGAWTARLLPELAALLSVTRQVQAWMAPTRGIDASQMPCWLFDRPAGQRAIYGLPPDHWSTGQGAGCPSRHPKVAFHGSTDIVDPGVGAAPVTDEDIEGLRTVYSAIAPHLAGELAHAATCLYTMSPDGHFIVGTRRGCQRTHFAAGLSGHGFKLAPALGDALVDLALRGRTDLPIGFLSPTRFERATGRPGDDL